MILRRDIRQYLALIGLVAAGSFESLSQTPQEQRTLLGLSQQYGTQWQLQRALAESIAVLTNLPIRKEYPDGRIIELQGYEFGMPVYHASRNLNAARTVSSDRVWPGGSGGFSLTGVGVTLGVWEIGGIRTTHQEFGGRVTYGDAGTALGQHATHVAGTMIAAGVSSSAKGMSYQANLLAYTSGNDMSEMAAAAAGGLRVSNHSYGPLVGWETNFLGDGLWAWLGNLSVSAAEDYIFGFYGTSSQSVDNIAANAPNYLIVGAIGNDRINKGPTVDSTDHWDRVNGVWTLQKDSHSPDGGGPGATAGYGSVSGFQVAKNVLGVGSVNDITGGYNGLSSVVMTTYSAWGPTDDGRIKPDIVANGQSLTSTFPGGDATYGTMSGTSMASPSVAGSIGLLLQHQKNLTASDAIRSSTMKGILIHTADEAGPSPGPDYMFGWGLMNTLKATQLMTANALAGGNFNIRVETLTLNNTIEFQIEATGTEPLRATIVWTDPAGTPPAASLNPTIKMLKNDLDLRIIGPSATTFFPWVLNPASPASAATTGDNNTDNVEQVHIALPTPGLYTIRVNHKGSLSPSGSQVVSIIVTGAAQQASAPPAIPTLASPTDGALNIAVSPTLSWNASSGATSYGLQVSTSNAFLSPFVNVANISGTSQPVPNLSSSMTYYWRVNAANSVGTSDWSSIRSFTTGTTPPAAPTLASPSDAATGIVTNPTLTWNSAATATSYRVQVSTGNTFSTTIIDQSGLTSTSLNASGLQGNTTYYWRVNASNTGGEGGWSTTWSFTTIATPPMAPLLSSPENGLIDASTSLMLSWGASLNATSYRVQVSTDSTFASLFLSDSITSTSRTVSGLANSTGYFWRVNAKNSQGTGAFSEAWSFTTAAGAPAAPLLGSPANGATIFSGGPVVTWFRSNAATAYRLQVSSHQNFRQIVLDQNDIADTAYTVSSLSAATYYWRVSASNAGGGSDFSTARNFIVSAPAAPTLASPAANASAVPLPVSFSWNASSGALSYQIQIATASNFNNIVKDSAGIAASSVDMGGLASSTTYHWRVRAVSDVGTGAFSSSRNFTTAGATSVSRDPSFLPDRFELHQNFPNPFNPSTVIRFDVASRSVVLLTVHDMFGREVARLVEGELQAGRYEAQFSGNDLSSGVYFCRLRTGEQMFVRKMVLTR